MLKRATRPFPLPATDWISKSATFNSFMGSLPDTYPAMVVGISGSSGLYSFSSMCPIKYNITNLFIGPSDSGLTPKMEINVMGRSNKVCSCWQGYGGRVRLIVYLSYSLLQGAILQVLLLSCLQFS